MMLLLNSVFGMLLSLGILVTVHEYGHFWMARRFGVKVERFSVGFGRPIWRRTDRSGTEFVEILNRIVLYIETIFAGSELLKCIERLLSFLQVNSIEKPDFVSV